MTRSVLEVTETDLDRVWRPFTQHSVRDTPPTFVSGHGCIVVDSDGTEYLDSMSGLCCVNVGYGQERVIEAATKQLRDLAFTSPGHPAAVTYEYADELVQVLPGDLKHVMFVASGSEANEPRSRSHVSTRARSSPTSGGPRSSVAI